MKPSEFLGYCARRLDQGYEITQFDAGLVSSTARLVAADYLRLIAPQPGDRGKGDKVLRFMLAAAMARDVGL